MKYTVKGSVIRVIGSGFRGEATLEVDGQVITTIESEESRPSEVEAIALKNELMDVLLEKASELIYQKRMSRPKRDLAVVG